MTLARLIPLDMHGALEAALGALMIVAPFALGFEPAGLVASVLIGALLVAVALASDASESSVVPVSSHAAFDGFFTAAMAIGAGAFAFAGDLAAASFFAASALVSTLLISLTRYSEPTA